MLGDDAISQPGWPSGGAVKSVSSLSTRCWTRLWQKRRRKRPPVSVERLNYLRRLQKVGGTLGFDQGLCIDRYYIERFLSNYALDIHGYVLEIG
ncbi:MAG: hypothetical protein HYU85_02765, partial [Chloroflexi bacterium]|nr:hypothetical protein [Chloroflexota bacterium]